MALGRLLSAAAVVLLASSALASPLAALSRETLNRAYSPTPGGAYVRKDCIYTIPSGSSVEVVDGAFHVTEQGAAQAYALPRCRANATHPIMARALPADYDGWLAYVAYNISGTFDTFTGYMSTPDVAKSTPQILYLFTGLQNKDWVPLHDPESQGEGFDILQPVLQYPGDFGKYWSVKSWYVTIDAGAVSSSELRLETGDRVFGNMTRLDGTKWLVDSVTPSNKHTSITPSHERLTTQPWAYNVMEAYGVSGCDDYPDQASVFINLVLTDGSGSKVTPAWRLNPKPDFKHFCQEKVVVTDPTSVKFTFH